MCCFFNDFVKLGKIHIKVYPVGVSSELSSDSATLDCHTHDEIWRCNSCADNAIYWERKCYLVLDDYHDICIYYPETRQDWATRYGKLKITDQ